MNPDLANNVMTERDPNLATRTVDIPKHGKQFEDDMSEDVKMELTEASAEVTSPATVSSTWAVCLHIYYHSS